jgi:hypothetical protein
VGIRVNPCPISLVGLRRSFSRKRPQNVLRIAARMKPMKRSVLAISLP